MIEGQYTYSCDFCDAEISGPTWTCTITNRGISPITPKGWLAVGSSLMCGDHDLSEITLADVVK